MSKMETAQRNNERGFIMALVLIILTILTVFGMAMMMLSSVNMETAGNLRADQQALNIAYTRYQRAESYLLNAACSLNTTGGTNLLDTAANSVLDNLDAVSSIASDTGIVCESVQQTSSPALKSKLGVGGLHIWGVMRSCQNPGVARDHFLIKSIGVLNGVKRTIEARVEYKSYLNFSRFCINNLAFDDHLTVYGDVYCGGTLDVGAGDHFKGDVYTQLITNRSNGVYDGNVYTNYKKTINLDIDRQIADFYTNASACGWVINSTHGLNSLRNSTMDTSHTHNWLKLDDLKSLEAGTPNPRYEGATSTYNLPVDANGLSNFNGIIFWDDSNGYDLHVSGSLATVPEADGKNHGRSIVIIARAHNIVLDYGIQMGADSLNQPVNLAFIVTNASKQLLFAQNGPIFWANHAAIMITKKGAPSWTRAGSYSDSSATDTAYKNRVGGGGSNLYPVTENVCGGSAATCHNRDLDGSGSLEILDAYGWKETNLTEAKTNALFQYGPMITLAQGDRGLWHWNYAAPDNGSTLIYKENPNIVMYPPPFPKIRSLIHVVSYSEYEGGD